MEKKYKKAHMAAAEVYAELSYAKRKKVGVTTLRVKLSCHELISP